MFRASTSRHPQPLRPSSLRLPRRTASGAFVAWLVVMAGAAAAQPPARPPEAAPGPPAAASAGKSGTLAPASLVTFPGGIVWQTALPAVPAHPPAFDGNRSFVVLRDDTLVALVLDTGAVAWTQPQTSSVAPAAGDGLVFGARESDAWARDATTGDARWEQALGAPVATPLVAGPGVLVLGTAAGDVVCLNAPDGTIRWRQPQGSRASVAPALLGSRVFAGLTDGRIVALDGATGLLRWTQQVRGSVTALTVTDTRVYVGSDDNFLYVLDTKDGAPKWKWRTGGDLVGETIVDAQRLYYVSLDNTLRAHKRRNGQLAWQQSLTSRPAGGPTWIGDRVVVGGIAPELRAFKVKDGQPDGVVGVPGRVLHRPYLMAPAGGVPARLVVVTGGGQVQAIGQTIEPPLLPLEALPGSRLAPETIKAKVTVPMLTDSQE